MSLNDYQKAAKMGRREMNLRTLKGENPYLPSLDDIIKRGDIASEVPLGIVQIPTDRIAGTKSSDRRNAFAANFMPVLDERSEFAIKWVSLCESHIRRRNSGSNQSLRIYEQILCPGRQQTCQCSKILGAVSIVGQVIRLIPHRTEEKENKIYFEFLDFYELSEINYIWFTKEKSFSKLQRLVGKMPDERWTTEDRLKFSSILSRFTALYDTDDLDGLTIGDAFLSFIELYGYEQMYNMPTSSLKRLIKNRQEQLEAFASNQPLQTSHEPYRGENKSFKTSSPGNKIYIASSFYPMKNLPKPLRGPTPTN